MCGIVYARNSLGKPVNRKVLKRFRAQRLRGTDGFGFYLPEVDRLTHSPRESTIVRQLKRFDSSEVLFHHRFPTSTKNVRNACHPFSTRLNDKLFKRRYILVHNGVVQNDTELEEAHSKLGISYVSDQGYTFNDSEALLYDIALTLEGKQDKMQAHGSIAFVCMELNKKGKPIKLHFGRNYGSPLNMTYTEKELVLASEGSGEPIDEDTLYSYDYDKAALTTQGFEIPAYRAIGYSQHIWHNGKRDEFEDWEDYQEYTYGHTTNKVHAADIGQKSLVSGAGELEAGRLVKLRQSAEEYANSILQKCDYKYPQAMLAVQGVIDSILENISAEKAKPEDDQNKYLLWLLNQNLARCESAFDVLEVQHIEWQGIERESQLSLPSGKKE